MPEPFTKPGDRIAVAGFGHDHNMLASGLREDSGKQVLMPDRQQIDRAIGGATQAALAIKAEAVSDVKKANQGVEQPARNRVEHCDRPRRDHDA